MAQRSRGATPVRSAPAGAGRSGGRGEANRADAGRAASPSRAELAAHGAWLRGVIEPVVAQANLDLEDLAVSRAGRRYVVRVIVDGDGGVNLDEIAELSRGVSAAIDEAEQAGGGFAAKELAGPYQLEVSSPGTDRPLTEPRHWRRNIGRLVSVKAGERSLTGRVAEVDAESVTLDVNGRPERVPMGQLGAGRVQLEFTRLAELAEDEFGEEIADEIGEDEEVDGE
jgi:ribosome maturation factor RimP